MFKKILVTTDASDYSRRALETALKLARTFQAEVELLHVSYMPQSYLGYTISYGITVTQEQLDENGEMALEATLMNVDTSGVVLTKKVESGHPVAVILEEIKKGQFELVVMGSHGYGMIQGSLLGSISQRVLQRANCPVLIIK